MPCYCLMPGQQNVLTSYRCEECMWCRYQVSSSQADCYPAFAKHPKAQTPPFPQLDNSLWPPWLLLSSCCSLMCCQTGPPRQAYHYTFMLQTIQSNLAVRIGPCHTLLPALVQAGAPIRLPRLMAYKLWMRSSQGLQLVLLRRCPKISRCCTAHMQ